MKFDLTKIKISKNDEKRGVFFPKQSNCKLAEFIGILTGDGYINYYPKKEDYIIEIAGDSRFDKEYLTQYMPSIIKRLFNVVPSIYYRKNKNAMYLRIRSKGLFNFLRCANFKNGLKGQITIPSWILKNDKYMISFIKGFADTDGCLMFKKDNNYPVIKLCSISRDLMDLITIWLKQNNFSPCLYNETRFDKRTNKKHEINNIYINGRKNLSKWANMIGFSNLKHLNKYKKYGMGEI